MFNYATVPFYAAVSQDATIRASDLRSDLAELDLQEYNRPEGHPMTSEEPAKDYIAHVSRVTDAVHTRTAGLPGIDRASLWRKIRKYGLEQLTFKYATVPF
jgi:transcriptional regulator of acetoin/glycerol metabolism